MSNEPLTREPKPNDDVPKHNFNLSGHVYMHIDQYDADIPIPYTGESGEWLREKTREITRLSSMEFFALRYGSQTVLTTGYAHPRCDADLKPKRTWTYSKPHPLDAWEAVEVV